MLIEECLVIRYAYITIGKTDLMTMYKMNMQVKHSCMQGFDAGSETIAAYMYVHYNRGNVAISIVGLFSFINFSVEKETYLLVLFIQGDISQRGHLRCSQV